MSLFPLFKDFIVSAYTVDRVASSRLKYTSLLSSQFVSEETDKFASLKFELVKLWELWFNLQIL